MFLLFFSSFSLFADFRPDNLSLTLSLSLSCRLLLLQGSDPAIELLEKLSLRKMNVDGFLIEVTKVFCSTHELEIDMIKHVHDAMMRPEEENGGEEGGEGGGTTTTTTTAAASMDHKSFVTVLPVLGINGSPIVLADYFLQVGRSGQECFVDFILDNTNRFSHGSYQPLIQKCSQALSILLSGV